ncbi:MAG: multifunctional CCA addition/repair protein [Gammaproteobacteria bacterium]|nr:multifunctional CCA addition/repair protein [Gammaproteobacteria bacterium]
MPEPTLYKVGGAVRDRLLDLPVKDTDWVVVGATVEEMESRGFKAVGKDFPVFLHPETREEYALARTERKTAPGYTGFSFHADAEVSLEQDLLRRDLTINAMAEDETGKIIDPYGGQADLDARLLRHVSPAFSEDPVRILRVARFLARLQPLGFRIAEETLELMREMVQNGEVDALVPERVWQETMRALSEPSPQSFILALRDCGALATIFPEIDRLFGVPQPEEHHPEIDTGVHTMMVLEQAARLSDDAQVRFAALVHDLGKGITPQDQWPRHIDHEEKGVPLVEAMCERLRCPREYRDLGVNVTRYHLCFHRAGELKASTLVDLLQKLDAYRKPERFDKWLLACEADSRGRPGYEDRELQQPAILKRAYATCREVEARAFAEQGLSGPRIGEAVREERIRRLKAQRG